MERRNYADGRQTTRVQWRMVLGTDADQVQREVDRSAAWAPSKPRGMTALATVLYMVYGAFLLGTVVALTHC